MDLVIDEAELAREEAALMAEAGEAPVLLPVVPVKSAEEVKADHVKAEQVSKDEAGVKEYSELLKMVMGPGFAVLAPAWGVTEAEIQTLSDAYSGLLQKYAPGQIGNYGVEISAVLVTAMVFAPRVGKPRREIEVNRDKKPDAPKPEAQKTGVPVPGQKALPSPETFEKSNGGTVPITGGQDVQVSEQGLPE